MTHAAEQGTAGRDHSSGHDRRGGKLGVALWEVFAPQSLDASDSIDGALESSAAGTRGGEDQSARARDYLHRAIGDRGDLRFGRPGR
jgi:hypothetical protein